ncbi:MAG: glycoside hydrolase family 20 zincin-like fold domain-containing protein [Bacteroidales bacterium]
MKRSVLFTLSLVVLFSISSSVLAIIPTPQSYVRTASMFAINAKTVWVVENEEQAEIARLLSEKVEKLCGIEMQIISGSKGSKNIIRFATDVTLKEEEYRLSVDVRQIILEASSRKGFLNGVQTLRQLMPAEIENGSPVAGGVIQIPGGTIKDAPYLEVRAIKLKKQPRGLSKSQMLAFLDVMALHKLNRLYWLPVDEYGAPMDKEMIHEIGTYATNRCIELATDETELDDQLANPNLDNTIILEPEELHCILKDVFMYKPGSGLRYSDHLQGMIGNIHGSEGDMTIYDVWRAFPNAAAFAEICWSGKKERDWKLFVKEMDKLLPAYNALKMDYSKSMYELSYTTNVKDKKVQVSIVSVRPDIDVRYTLEGETPTRLSALLKTPMMVTETKNIFAIGFQGDKEMSDPLFLDFHFNKATAKPIFSPKSKTPSLLVDGLRAFPDETFGWVYYPDQKASMTIDLLETLPVQQVRFGVIGGKKAIVYVSQDGARFTQVGEKTLNKKETEYSFSGLNAEGRFVKLVVEPVEEADSDVLRLDEIIVE